MKQEVGTQTFYNSIKNTKNLPKYLTPIERKILRDSKQISPIKARPTETPEIKNKSTNEKAMKNEEENKTPMKRGIHKRILKSPTSPTINWAPNSLGKRFNQKSKYDDVMIKMTSRSPQPRSPLTRTPTKEVPPPLIDRTPPAKFARVEQPHASLPKCDDVTVDPTKLESPKFYPIFTRSRTPKTSSPLFTSKLLSNGNRMVTRKSTPSPKQSPKVQMIIDAGQKKFGPIQCETCGMVYSVDHPHDQEQHQIHHASFLDILRFPGWKKERVVASFMDGRIIKILPSDPKYVTNKVEEIEKLIDNELGFNRNRHSTRITFLHISDEQQVIGCLVSEPITQAFPLLPSMTSSMMSCSLQSVPVTCGVGRIWCHASHRKRGVATRLMDALRCSFVLGAQLDRNQIAFSDPTVSGKEFAMKYFGTDQFLTYNCM